MSQDAGYASRVPLLRTLSDEALPVTHVAIDHRRGAMPQGNQKPVERSRALVRRALGMQGA